jgi:hypothetical protein
VGLRLPGERTHNERNEEAAVPRVKRKAQNQEDHGDYLIVRATQSVDESPILAS